MAISLLAVVMACALAIYVLLGGADYGAGFWDLLSAGKLSTQQRSLIASAIRPIWEANHVWLILIFVLLFTGFPKAFGAIMIALFVPILLTLLGIVLRGASFVFRAYATTDSPMQRACAFVFSASSSFTPVLGGMVLASLSDDRVFVAGDRSINGYLLNWISPFSTAVGILTLAIVAYLAAAYLAVEAPTEELSQMFRWRAIVSSVMAGLKGLLVFVLMGRYARGLQAGLLHRPIAIFAEIAASLSLILGLMALLKGRMLAARALAAAYAASIVGAWAAAQYPYLARPSITIFNSFLAANVVYDVLLALAVGAVVLLPSFALLLYIFKDRRAQAAAVQS